MQRSAEDPQFGSVLPPFFDPRPEARARQKKRNDMSLGEKNNKILSVGIDIGTTTTSMILSKLAVENTAMVYMAPNVELTSKEIIYRSPVYLTPLISEDDAYKYLRSISMNKRKSIAEVAKIIVDTESMLH